MKRCWSWSASQGAASENCIVSYRYFHSLTVFLEPTFTVACLTVQQVISIPFTSSHQNYYHLQSKQAQPDCKSWPLSPITMCRTGSSSSIASSVYLWD